MDSFPVAAFVVSAAFMLKSARRLQLEEGGSSQPFALAAPSEPSSCPFGFKSSTSNDNNNNKNSYSNNNNNNDISSSQQLTVDTYEDATAVKQKHPKEKLADFISRSGKVINLYDMYVHFPMLKEVWDHPNTGNINSASWGSSVVAGFHGIELGFLLLSEFVRDSRSYLIRRPRLEQVCHDIVIQFQLLSTLLEGRLGEKLGSSELSMLPLVSEFQSNGNSSGEGGSSSSSHRPSTGLALLIDNIKNILQSPDPIDRDKCLFVMVKTIITSFTATLVALNSEVGLGIESQMIELASLLGISDKSIKVCSRNIDYYNIIQPNVPLATLKDEVYEHREDFFFRTIHLGTECWAFIAQSRIEMARRFAFSRNWYQAAVQIRYASDILNYLGDHVMLLTTMILRDYLQLKVEIQGTSGEGSIAVKGFRAAVLSLLDPLTKDLIDVEDSALLSPSEEKGFKDVLAVVYNKPEAFPKLYDYCKALECIESALLGGFYYKHFLLASNVIGLGAKGTMNRSVKALKATFEAACFPVLDNIRSELGSTIDNELRHNHAKIMVEIERKNPGLFPNFQVTPASSPVKSTVVREPGVEEDLLQRCSAAEHGKSLMSP